MPALESAPAVRIAGKQQRVPRRPQHRFYIESKPWEISPVMIAPVLPGETLKNLLVQARVVSAPIVSSVVGWWCEYYFFYVKHRQLPSTANLQAMVLDGSTTLSATSANTAHYYDGRGFNFVGECLQTVVEQWFREEGEAYASGVTAGRGSRPLARIGIEDFSDSLISATNNPTGGALGATQRAQDQAWELYSYLREMKFTQATYEDWVATYGVDIGQAAERDRPELLRYVREWSYPTNTVEPTTGTPSAAMSWGIADRADKDRFFTEPGFIFGVQVLRPKVYLGNQTGNASSMLDRVMRWLPAIMSDDPSSSLAEFTSTQGPFGKAASGFTENYWLDVRDLFIHGDQFLDGTSQANAIALPTTAQVIKFATEAMGDALFSGATKTVRADGNVSLNILGTQRDYT